MIKLLIVIPYQELTESFNKELSLFDTTGIEVETTHFYGTNLSVFKSIVADVLVARGITSRAIAKVRPDIHVVDVPISSSDLVSALYVSKKQFGSCHVGIMVADLGICNPEELGYLLDMPITVRKITYDEDVDHSIDELTKLGCKVLIGGLTVCRKCEKKGLSHVHITTGESAVHQSLREAITVSHSLNRERARLNLISTMLNSTKDSMLAIGSDSVVFASNSQADTLFNSKIEGMKISSVLPELSWKPTLEAGVEIERIMNLNSTQMLVTQVPIMMNDEAQGVLVTIQNVEEIRQTEQRIRKELNKKGLFAKYHFGDIIYRNEGMKMLIGRAIRYAQVDSNVLIVGETGTGKELFAQSIHNASSRSSKPFVAVNCAALPEQLLESELFGYSDGAFSGAVKGGKAGLFELAHSGTIFLDEIGEMPLKLQAKILRVLQEKEVRKVGGDKVVPVDVRVISATNSDVRELIKDGLFRKDLFYRINILNISIPSLKKRPEDIMVILKHFIEKLATNLNRSLPEFDDEAIKIIEEYEWPGNIRELRNLAEQIVVLYWGNTIGKNEILSLLPQDDSPLIKNPVSVRKTKAEDIKKTYEASGLSIKEFSEKYGISRTTLWRRLSST